MPPAWLLSRLHLALSVDPAGDDALALRATRWPERRLAWPLEDRDGPVLCGGARLLRCSLLAGRGADETAAVAGLLARLRSALPPQRCTLLALLLAGRVPVPLLARRSLADITVPSEHVGPSTFSLSRALSLLRTHGAAALPPCCVPAAELAWLRRLAASRVAAAEAALRERGLRPFDDAFALADAASRGRGRLELRLRLDCGSGGSGGEGGDGDNGCRLLRLALSCPGLAPLARAALAAARPLTTASLVVARPGLAGHQEWHSDGPPHDSEGADAAGGASTPSGAAHQAPSALCVFVPLVDLTPATGCTHLWLGSHAAPRGDGAGCGGDDRTHPLVGPAPAALAALSAAGGGGSGAPAWTEPQPLAAGSALAYDYALVHRGGACAAVPGGGDRPLLQLVFRRPGGAGRGGGWDEGGNFVGGETLLGGGGGGVGGAWAVPAAADSLPGFDGGAAAADAAEEEEEAQAAAGAAWWAAAAAAAAAARAVAEAGEGEKGSAVAVAQTPPVTGFSVFDA